MSITMSTKTALGGRLATLAFLGIFLSACATTQPTPQGAVEVRNKLTTLQTDPNLRERARVEIREAEKAVRLAEEPVSNDNASLGEHRVYMAERLVGIAEAKASTQYAESLRAGLGEQRAAARLQARTLEADRARTEADQANADALRERNAADMARNAEAQASSESALKAAELQKRIADLEAEATERGLVLTLGDVLFATGSAELRGGTNTKLNKVVTFLNQYPQRRAIIEGHTDNVGQADFNQGLSQRRADAVRSYLTQQGVAATRLSSAGMGMDQPVSSNGDSTGRQQNRRVEIIIENTPDA